MRYLFPILLLAASILLCICAAPSVVSTLYPAASVSGAITAGHYASVTQTSHFLVLCFPLRHDKLTTSASSGAQHICFQRSRL